MDSSINWVVVNLYIFWLALILAVQEIQIEGKHGWAEKLPAWRPKKGTWYANFFDVAFGNDLTGYHFATVLLMISFFHLPFFFGFSWTPEHELEILALYGLFGPVWDFLWFVFNPDYPLKNFNGKFIPWHKEWFLGLPKQYWSQGVLSLAAVVWLMFLLGGSSPLVWWVKNIIQFLVEILVAVVFSKAVLNIDSWPKQD